MRPVSSAALAGLLAGLALAGPGTPAARGGDAQRPMPGAGRELGVPTEGLDRVRLDDGRVLACRLEEQKGEVLLKFATFTAKVPKSRILESRRFADYDSTPRNPEEQALVAKGQVRFGGRWMPRDAAARAAKADEDAARRIREADEAHADWEKNRWKFETDHFQIEANIPLAAANYYADLLENYYDCFTKIFGVSLTSREKKRKYPVYLLRTRDEFRKFHDQDTGGKSENLLGYFVPVKGQERLVFFDIADSRQETVDVMYHEGTHFIIHLAEPDVIVSRWVHEGCAEYFGASSFDGKKVKTGLVQDGRLLGFQQMIAENRVLPMERLMRSANPFKEGEKPDPFEGEQYAQAWTTVHYLMDGKGGKYRAGFISYLQKYLQRKGKMVAIEASERKYMDFEESKAQLLRCTGIKDLETLVKEVVEYAKTLPMRGAEAYALRGAMLTFSEKPDPDQARKDFETALERGKDDPAVLARLAIIFSNLPDRFGEVIPLLRRSLELDPLSAQRRFFLARLLLNSGNAAEGQAELETCIQVNPDYGPAIGEYARLLFHTRLQQRDRPETDEEKETLRRALALAERGVALDPSATAQHTLACLLALAGEFDRSRDAAKTAVEMDPQNDVYLVRLASAYALAGQADEFARILRRLEKLEKRATAPAGGATLQEGAPDAAAAVREQMGEFVRRTVDACMAWDRRAQAAAALKAWYERRAPKSQDEWEYYARILLESGDAEGAAKIAGDGLKAFPASEILKACLGGAGEGGR